MKKFLLSMTPLWSMFLSAIVEKPIVIIIPSYNNEKYVEKNLNSVYDQEYENYRVVYVDDCSKDKTLAMVRDIVARRGQEHRTTIIHNEHNCGAMANFYHAIHNLFDDQDFVEGAPSSVETMSTSGYVCNDNDIIIQLDGDDWLKHNRVFARVNQEYSDHDVWMTYGRCEYYPEGKPDGQKLLPKQIIAKGAYREYERVPSHLRTFYAGLFKQIALQDFLYNGAFLSMNCDLAMMFPLLEMANGKVGFINDIIHVYNCATPLNDYKKNILLQLHLDHVLRSRDKYKPVSTFETPSLKFEPAVFIVSSDTEKAAVCKKSLESSVSSIGPIEVISPEIRAKDLLRELDAVLSDFIFVVDEALRCAAPFDSTTFTQALAQTKAQVFCLDRDMHAAEAHDIVFLMVNENVYGWQFVLGEHEWRKPFGARAHIYAKKTLKEALSRLKLPAGKNIFEALNGLIVDVNSVGLCSPEPFFKECV
jgi:glycosyltransferase involved in cell wall biosynthesis